MRSRSLRGLDLGGLRARWHTAFRRRAPPHLPRHLLFRILAYRLQADRLGDLDGECRRLLDRIGSVLRKRDSAPRTWAGALPRFGPAPCWAANGTVGCIGWRCLLMALPGTARPTASLSKVAFAITGTRWNGPKFFGLRDKPSKGPQHEDRTSKTVRCAIYTRVSTDQGLEQDFNSLDAQYDASQAYIRSQAHAGWTLLRAKYDDGGFSGGNTERPALQRLLEDVRAGKVDVIVVYKVDRLTRSLADFAKLVELFDAHNVSFVSVTQQFNTTTSMGRLTLNVLLSFAQFEREVTSERIRDKIAASKRKGLWVGGMAPLGYDTKDRKISVNEAEAEQVRSIFCQLSAAWQPQPADGGSAQARHRHQGSHAEDRRESWWHPVHAGTARLSASQPVLYRRGRLQG